jgi:hypothetical protein
MKLSDGSLAARIGVDDRTVRFSLGDAAARAARHAD